MKKRKFKMFEKGQKEHMDKGYAKPEEAPKAAPQEAVAEAVKAPVVAETSAVPAPEEGAKVFTWEAPEFEHRPKSTNWYWWSIGIAIVIISIALVRKNFLFALIVVIAELLVFHKGEEHPRLWQFSLDERGLTIEGHKTYRYADMVKYDIHPFSDEYHELVVHLKAKASPHLKVFIHAKDERAVEGMLEGKVKRGDIPGSLVDHIERLIGF